jgi:hypothetical protein
MHKGFLSATAVVAWLALLTIAAGDAGAQTYILQGEKGEQGEGLSCDVTDCAVSGGQNLVVDGDVAATGDLSASNAVFSGDLDVAGHGYFEMLTVQASYWLPECPEGYERDDTVTDYVLCEKVLAGGVDRVVKVGDFWVDKYQLSAFSEPGCTGTQYGVSSDNWEMPDNGNWAGAGDDAFACSISGVTPSRYMTWFQAQQACHAAGKSLCTNAQWQAAAAGTHDPGSTYSGSQCNIDSSGPRATGGAGTTPGGSSDCVSMWGADDMIGNLWEWTSDWWGQGSDSMQQDQDAAFGEDGHWNVDPAESQGGYSTSFPAAALRGGRWDDGSQAGVFALTLKSGPSNLYGSSGARCCMGR